MLPSLKQRLLIAVTIAIGSFFWFMAKDTLSPADGATGLSLVRAHGGLVLAVIIMLLLGIPALVGAVKVSITGNALSGIFATAFSLMILTIAGGPMTGWLLAIASPSAYHGLVVEMLLWLVGLAALVAVIHKIRPQVRARMVESSFLKRFLDTDEPPYEVKLGLPDGSGLMAGLICALAGGLLSMVLIRSSESGQVIGALLVSFTVAGTCGQMFQSKKSSPVALLFAPGLVAIAAYVWVSMNYQTHDQMLAAWFSQTSSSGAGHGRILSLALALPMHYISAGVAGTVMGIGLGQSIQHAQLLASEATA